jgi:hypothetical protein
VCVRCFSCSYTVNSTTSVASNDPSFSLILEFEPLKIKFSLQNRPHVGTCFIFESRARVASRSLLH